tara:strand:- start:146 stop:532 length:387 start_codon:yes stop_codon:yes gene_type:complete
LITEVVAGCAKKAFTGQRCCIAIRVEKEEGEIGESLSLNALPLRYPIPFTQHERLLFYPLQGIDALRYGQRANLSVVFLNGDTLTARTRETAELYTPNSTEDVLVSSGGIKNIDLSIITLEIEIVHHG